VPLAELLQQSVEANAGFAEKCEVRFVLEQVSVNDRVMADPDRLMQVVANLLSNAAKFSPPGSDVLIRVRPGATTMRIEVEDSGAGIPEEFKAHIFGKFAQADASAARRFEGTGLGLSIARKLTEAMGGIIGFDSRVDQGSNCREWKLRPRCSAPLGFPRRPPIKCSAAWPIRARWKPAPLCRGCCMWKTTKI
jgi:signal transduction histidine kinase